MQSFIISLAIKLVLKILLSKLTVDNVIGIVRKAEEIFTTNSEKHDYAKKELVKNEANKKDSTTNFIIEAAVFLYKTIK